jgi:hypothetical protein
MVQSVSKDRFKTRLQPLQIAAQLPDNPHTASRILDAARQLVVDGMDDDGGDQNVVHIVKPDGAG